MDDTKGTLKPALSEKVQGIIWKMLLNEDNHTLAVESRDVDNKQVYFSVFDYKDGIVVLKNYKLQERWGLAMAHLGDQSLFIKIYPDEGSPVTKGIIAIDYRTGNIRWERYNVAYHNAWQEGIEAYNPDMLPRKPFILDSENGTEKKTTERTPVLSSVVLPEYRDANVIPGLAFESIEGSVMYAETPGKHFVSFHERVQGNLRLRIVGYQDVNILFDDILLNDIQKLQPEAFFIVQDHLFCIRGNTEVISYLV